MFPSRSLLVCITSTALPAALLPPLPPVHHLLQACNLPVVGLQLEPAPHAQLAALQLQPGAGLHAVPGEVMVAGGALTRRDERTAAVSTVHGLAPD